MDTKRVYREDVNNNKIKRVYPPAPPPYCGATGSDNVYTVHSLLATMGYDEAFLQDFLENIKLLNSSSLLYNFVSVVL